MVMVIEAVVQDAERNVRGERRAIALIDELKLRGIYVPTNLKETQHLLGMTQERCADTAVRHYHRPLMRD